MRRTVTRAIVVGFVLGVLAAASAASAQDHPTISATLHPTEISLGHYARLEITVSGVSSASPPRLPNIDGLEVQTAGQTMSVQILNGQTTSQVRHGFVLRPTRVGSFAIPPISVTVGGQTVSTTPLTLSVVAPGTLPRPAPPKKPGPQQPSAPVEPSEDPVFLRIVGLPERPLFVGEVLPVELQLYVHEGARVTQATPPQVGGNGFTLDRPNNQEPRQDIVRLNGTRFVRLVFPAALSPIKPGDLQLSVALEVTALVPERRRSRYFGDPLFDSLLDPFAMGHGTEKKFPIQSPDKTVQVSPLPEQGRPAGFSGGVGKFTLSAEASPKRVKIGDPITLELTVAGEGNFDRLKLTPLESSAAWKTYDPSARFEPRGDLGIEGKKVFEQAVMPLRPDLPGVPARELSYFDPEARRYVTVATPAIPLEILPSGAPLRSAGTAPGSQGVQGEASKDDLALAPNHVDIGRTWRDLRPSVLSPWFAMVQAFPLLLLAATGLWMRRRTRLEGDPLYVRNRAARREVRALVAKMRQAAASRDARGFFDTARRAIQERLATRIGAASASSLTLGEIEEHLESEPDVQSAVREIFFAADQIAYGRHDEDNAELAEWQSKVEKVLAGLGAAGSR